MIALAFFLVFVVSWIGSLLYLFGTMEVIV